MYAKAIKRYIPFIFFFFFEISRLGGGGTTNRQTGCKQISTPWHPDRAMYIYNSNNSAS